MFRTAGGRADLAVDAPRHSGALRRYMDSADAHPSAAEMVARDDAAGEPRADARASGGRTHGAAHWARRDDCRILRPRAARLRVGRRGLLFRHRLGAAPRRLGRRLGRNRLRALGRQAARGRRCSRRSRPAKGSAPASRPPRRRASRRTPRHTSGVTRGRAVWRKAG